MGKIIVLEDNTLFAEIVCRWLQREGWKTETVTNISRAKKQMEKADTDDIVLADLRLPDGVSTALLESMRKNGMEQPFIVIFCPSSLDIFSSTIFITASRACSFVYLLIYLYTCLYPSSFK